MSCLKVICWALIFIFKLRFPPGVSIATILNRLKSHMPHGKGSYEAYSDLALID
jgi:hypothetical protein